jgi:hypothetical protein
MGVYNPGTPEAEAGRSQDPGQHRLYSKFGASLDYIVRLSIKRKKGS